MVGDMELSTVSISMLHVIYYCMSSNCCDRQRKQAKSPPVLVSPTGLKFERSDLIKVFARILPVLQTEKCEAGCVGWISNPRSSDDAQWWADLLQRKFLSVVQAYVVGEAHLEGSHSDAAITKDLGVNSPFLTADNIRFPPVKVLDDIDLEYLAQNPLPIPNAFDGVNTVLTSSRTMTFTDLANEGVQPIDDMPEPAEIVPELLQDLEKRARQKEIEECQGLLLRRAADRAAEADDGIAPVSPELPLEIESSILQPPAGYSLPSYYVSELANQYARANIWGKTEIHLQLLEQEKQRLDTLNFTIHSRIGAIEKEAETVHNELAMMRQRREVLESLYTKHAEGLVGLEDERAALRSEKVQMEGKREKSIRERKESYDLTKEANTEKRTASAAGRLGGGRLNALKIVAPGRLQNSVPHGKHGLAAAPPNSYAVSQGTISPVPSQVSYLLSGFYPRVIRRTLRVCCLLVNDMGCVGAGTGNQTGEGTDPGGPSIVA